MIDIFVWIVLWICFLYSVKEEKYLKKKIDKLESDLSYYKDSHRRLQNYNDFVIDLVCKMENNLSCAEAKEKLKEYVVEELNIDWEELQERHDGTYYKNGPFEDPRYNQAMSAVLKKGKLKHE